MKRLGIWIVALGLITSSTAYAADIKWFGLTQVTIEQHDKDSNDDGIRFGADRVRIGYKAKLTDQVFSKLQLAFLKINTDVDLGSGKVGLKEGVLPEIIKDAVVGYKHSNAVKMSVGQFKTPLGMDYNSSGKKLDIIKRGSEKKLVFERAQGLMVSGRKIGGSFGYDIGIFNPSGRGIGSKNGGKKGEDSMYVGRLHYDMNKMLHVEAAYGSSATSVPGAEDITAYDIGARLKMGDLTVKVEYIAAQDLGGVANADEQVGYLHLGYMFHPMMEAVVRHYQSTEDSTDTDLGNTFVGLNLFLDNECRHCARVQIFYMAASGDENLYKGDAAYAKENRILLQYQASF